MKQESGRSWKCGLLFFISKEENYLLTDVAVHTLCVYDENHNLFRTWDTQLAVAKLFEALNYEKACSDSICFWTDHDMSDLEGTVLWVCKSPFHKNRKRKPNTHL